MVRLEGPHREQQGQAATPVLRGQAWGLGFVSRATGEPPGGWEQAWLWAWGTGDREAGEEVGTRIRKERMRLTSAGAMGTQRKGHGGEDADDGQGVRGGDRGGRRRARARLGDRESDGLCWGEDLGDRFGAQTGSHPFVPWGQALD